MELDENSANLPEKPPIADMPPEDGFDPPTDEDEDATPLRGFLSQEKARTDPTVDDKEDV